jgi:hypothetical protein
MRPRLPGRADLAPFHVSARFLEFRNLPIRDGHGARVTIAKCLDAAQHLLDLV